MEKTKSQIREGSEGDSAGVAAEPTPVPTRVATATPHEHASALGKVETYTEVVKIGPRGSSPTPGTRPLFSWDHAAAAALHGWNLHEHHAGAPIQITRAAYEAALKAASEPDATGRYVPHAAARSPYAP